MNISNNTVPHSSTSISKVCIFWVVLVVLVVFVLVFSYVALIFLHPSYHPYLYGYLTGQKRGWIGHTHDYDPKLGYKPIPGSIGAHYFPDGSTVPIRFSVEGLRIPSQGDWAPSRRPLVLALGCSFTHGDAVLAEETFNFLVARSLGGTALNGGVCGYGLTQMLIRAEDLITRFRPDYVLAQYSPWLICRSQSISGPSPVGIVPVPYFVSRTNGDIAISPPVFPSHAFGQSCDKYRAKPPQLAFLVQESLPFFLDQHLQLTQYRIRKLLGMIPRPEQDRSRIASYVYGSIWKMCQAAGATMVLVSLNDPVSVNDGENRIREHVIRELPGIVVADGYQALLQSIQNQDVDTYMRAYGHWRGNPLQLADRHPNSRAHAVIADEILSVLGGTCRTNVAPPQ